MDHARAGVHTQASRMQEVALRRVQRDTIPHGSLTCLLGNVSRDFGVEQSALQARGRRVPLAAAVRLERVEDLAVPAPALRHAAVQHCGARHVRSAQAGLQVVRFDKRLGAARYAAHARAVEWPLAAHCSVVPLLKHGQRIVAARRHAACVPACK